MSPIEGKRYPQNTLLLAFPAAVIPFQKTNKIYNPNPVHNKGTTPCSISKTKRSKSEDEDEACGRVYH